MSFEVIDSLFTIKADGIMTVAMAAVILLIGFFIKSKVNITGTFTPLVRIEETIVPD